MAEFTLIGFEKYLKASNSSLFADVVLPEGIDKEVLVDTIILKGGEFEPVYMDPYFMKSAIKSWSIKWNRTFSKWLTALSIDYNPLENYDRIEDSTDTRTETAEAHDESSSSGSGTTNNGRSAYNSTSDYNNHDNSSTNSTGSNISDALTEANGNTVHHARLHGNIGVTTSQQMLQSELDIAKWSLYDQIADMFINEFLIMIY